MKSIINWCNRNSIAAHLIGSFILSQSYWPINIYLNTLCSILGSLCFSSLIFIIKELTDIYKKNPTGFSPLDMLYNYAGWSAGTLLITLIK